MDKPPPYPTARPRILAIDTPELSALWPLCHAHVALQPVSLARLDAGLTAAVAPRAVIFALFAAAPDVFQTADRLTRLGYRGRVFALSGPLPNHRMVERELRADFPALRLRIRMLGALA